MSNPQYALTARETEVFALVGRGLTNSEIARVLVVEESTAKRHVHNLLHKLGARDRVALVIRAYELGYASSTAVHTPK